MPVVRRDPEQPSDRETDLVLDALRRELGPEADECERKFRAKLSGFVVEEYRQILGLFDVAPEEAEGEFVTGPWSPLLLTVLQDRVCGSFGWSPYPNVKRPEALWHSEEATGGHIDAGELDGIQGRTPHENMLRERRAAYYYQESQGKSDAAGDRRSRVRALAAERRRPSGQPRRVGGQEGRPGQPTFCLRDWNSTVALVHFGVRHSRYRGNLSNEYGVDLCGMLPGCESKGEAEWERRIGEKVRERNEAIRQLLGTRSRMADRKKTAGFVRERRTDFRRYFLPGFGTQMQSDIVRYEEFLAERDETDVQSFVENARRGTNVIALTEGVLNDTLDRSGVLMWEQLLQAMAAGMTDEQGRSETKKHLDEVQEWARSARVENLAAQDMSINREAALCLYEFSQPPASEMLYFGCEPYWETVQAGGGDTIDFADFLNSREQTIFVFQPELRGGTDLVGVALKALFFESVLGDESRQRRNHGRPLVAYVADEFHRFITSDKSHGEQSFLDTCRSFGAFCVLACQSTTSMTYVLHDIEGSGEKVEAAVSIILNNTGTKLFFRTTDVAARDWVEKLAPTGPGSVNVAAVRPLSTLGPGECYAVLVDGRFKRAQLEQWGAREESD